MVKQASVASTLESIVGSSNVSEDTKAFAVDGMAPRAVVQPGTYEEVAAVVEYANEEGLAVIPWGSGELMHVGNIPHRYDIALGVGRLDQVVDHEPADLTVTCQAGITLERLESHLNASGQTVALCSPFDPLATVGGSLATDCWGLAKATLGSPRDFTIGMRVVSPQGDLTRAGGKVVKNVAGYDMCKLYIGSLGTLGVIVEATFKVSPLPTRGSVLVVGSDHVGPLCRLSSAIDRLGLSVRATKIEHYSTGGLAKPYLLWLWLAGAEAAVARGVDQITAMATQGGLDHWGSPGADLESYRQTSWADMHPEIRDGSVSGVGLRISVLPTHIEEIMTRLPRSIDVKVTIVPDSGALFVEYYVDRAQAKHLLDQVIAVVDSAKGSVLVTHCDSELKQGLDVFGAPPPSFPLMRAVKQQFDPNNVLSPGRFVGRL